jgi:hypothetical protein
MADEIIGVPRDRADCLIKLDDTQMAHLRQTRALEFQVNLALWTLIVLAGKFAYDSDALSKHLCWVLVFGIVLVLGHYFFGCDPFRGLRTRTITSSCSTAAKLSGSEE